MNVFSPALSSAAAEYLSAHQCWHDRPGAEGRPPPAGEPVYAGAGYQGARTHARNFDSPFPGSRRRTAKSSSATRSNGMRAGPGDVLFRIADHRLVWVLIDVAERDLGAGDGRNERSSSGRARFRAETFAGAVSLIYPHLNAQTRTARIRIEVPNPDEVLRPDDVCRCRNRNRHAWPRARGAGKRRARQRQPASRSDRQGRRSFRAARRQAWPSRRRITSRSPTAWRRARPSSPPQTS